MTNSIVPSNSINSQSDFIRYIQDNSIGGRNLSIVGLSRLCEVSAQSIIEASHFKSDKLAEKLIESGFEASHLLEYGFCAQSAWLVVEYFAYESKAKAEGAKRLARLFGSIGVQSCFDAASKGESEIAIPDSYASALRLAADRHEALLIAEVKLKLANAKVEILEEDNDRQAEIIDELFDYSSILRIASFNKCDPKAFKWQDLKAASKVLGLDVKTAPCPNFGTRNLYSHSAWKLVYSSTRLPETNSIVAVS